MNSIVILFLAVTSALATGTTPAPPQVLTAIITTLCGALPPPPTSTQITTTQSTVIAADYRQLVSLLLAAFPANNYPTTAAFIATQATSTVPYSNSGTCKTFFSSLGTSFLADLNTAQQNTNNYYTNLIALLTPSTSG